SSFVAECKDLPVTSDGGIIATGLAEQPRQCQKRGLVAGMSGDPTLQSAHCASCITAFGKGEDAIIEHLAVAAGSVTARPQLGNRILSRVGGSPRAVRGGEASVIGARRYAQR